MTQTLSPTARTRLTRHRERGSAEREDLFAIIAEALVCHVGIVRDGEPVVLPSIHAADPDGPDDGGTLYLHGSVAAPWLLQAPGQVVCATFTIVDALVLARAAFSHSMNYRSAVVYGPARRVEDPAERDHALRLIVDHVIPADRHPARQQPQGAGCDGGDRRPTGRGVGEGPHRWPPGRARGRRGRDLGRTRPLADHGGRGPTRRRGAVPDDVRRRLADW